MNGMVWQNQAILRDKMTVAPFSFPKKTESSVRLLIWSAAYPILHFTLAHEHLPIGME